VSFDDYSKNHDWATSENFQFELWSDVGRELAMYYGAATTPTQGAASRVTRLLDADGTLILEYNSINTTTSPGLILDDCEAIFGN
jgi:peroxiredoxin